MPGMIERVGRAMAEAEGYAYDPVPYDRYARAAIEAMREPTGIMIQDGMNPPQNPADIFAARSWRAMIDAALTE